MNENLFIYTLKLLELKAMIVKKSIPEITIEDVTAYFLNFYFKNRQIINLVEVATYIFSISENRIIEYLNNVVITDKKLNLDDFKDMI